VPRKRLAVCFFGFLLTLLQGLRAGELSEELRGIWMHGTQIKTRKETRYWAERIEAANLNAVFLLVWYWGGEAYFKSDLCPMGEGVEKGHDPLGAMVEQCHKRGIQVHAWFVNGAYGASRIKHVLDVHPDWVVKDGGGGPLWYDLGKPEVRKFERDLMIECLKKYDIDGLHFDYIRYGPRYCFCPYCQKAFSERYGFKDLKGAWGRAFPFYGHVSANAVTKPTTSQVLVRFSNGFPAVALNRLGRGEVLLLNWHAEDLSPPCVAEVVRRTLKKWGIRKDRVFILTTEANKAAYGTRRSRRAFNSFSKLGFSPRWLNEKRLGVLQERDALILPALYLIPKETAERIESLVRSGTNAVFIDGPVRSMDRPSIRRLLGMEKVGKYFSSDVILLPQSRSGLIPVSGREADIEREKKIQAKWAEFRAWGVTQLVKDVYRHAKALKPKACISAAVFTPISSARRVFQDWPGWVRQRIVDFVVPMAYTEDTSALQRQIKEWKAVDPELRRIIPGLSIYVRRKGKTAAKPPELVLAQHAACMREGAKGNVYFSLRYLNDALTKAFLKGPYSKKVKPYSPLIDRYAVVSRHNVHVTRADPFSSLSVGNGSFVFTVDVTGLQTFPEFYDREGVPLHTMAEWAWHTQAPPRLFKLEETYEVYDTYGRPVRYPTNTNVPAAGWLRANPHKVDLGRIGLVLKRKDGRLADIKGLRDIDQILDLWEGVVSSDFSLEGERVSVRTCCHPDLSAVSVKIRSKLLKEGGIKISLAFPYGGAAWGRGFDDWESPDLHVTEIVREAPGKVVLKRTLDDLTYFCTVFHSAGLNFEKTGPHRFFLSPSGECSNEIETVIVFSGNEKGVRALSFKSTLEACRRHWKRFWESGGVIDLSGSKDPRWKELERRVVLSQYLTALQCAGSFPPAETGLTLNSWHGKFHLEMHWWHGVHFALWGRLHLLEKSLPWYKKILPAAKNTARFQGYRGCRWPKMVDPSGRESPSGIGPLLIWQQPHPIYYAELCWRENPERRTLEKYKDIVFETAEFLASFPVWDQKRGVYNLGPPLIGAPEVYIHRRRELKNQNFEIAYWRFGLETANKWRKRLGMGVEKKWQHVASHLPPLARKDGLYVAGENARETFEKYAVGHPSLLAPFGMLSDPTVDKEVMRETLKEVMRKWNWKSTWGWDYPLIAMTAARLGEPALAIEALLMDSPKNRFLPNGHKPEHGGLPVYLPANGGLLAAVAMMAAGWEGCPETQAPGFPQDGSWKVRWEGLRPMP